MNLNWLYTAISFIMLRWHDLFSFLENRTFLGTNWDWILAIIFLVITIRIILFPLFVKQIKSQRAMQALQPQMKELQAKHKGDREALQKEMMELYKREKANPLMGCLPIFLQLPVFISLFWILGRRLNPARVDAVEAGFPLELSNIELYGWTFEQYKSATQATLFDAPIAAAFMEVGWFDRDVGASFDDVNMLSVRLVAGILTLIMVATTFLTSRQMVLKTGWATDPTQLMMQRLMVYGLPFMLLFSGAFFPISVILYWVVNNLFSLGQQQWVLRKYPPPKTATKDAAPTGGRSGGGAKQAPGKGKAGAGKDGKVDGQSAVDGRKLAPKPGAKPKKLAPKGVPPKRPGGAGGAQSIPPKRKGSAPDAGKAPGKPAAKATPARTTPARTTPAKAAPGKTTPGKAGSGKRASGKAGSGPTGSGKAADGIADQVPPTGDGNGSTKGSGGGRTSSESWPAVPPFEPRRRGESDRLGRRSD